MLEADDYKKFKQLFTNSFIENNKRIKWCPGKNCTMVFESTLGEAVDILCDCGASFCFGCDEQAHKPLTCKAQEKWTEKIKRTGAGDVGDGWVKLNTKACPKCGVRIEKNSGCMHITCTKCGHGFCWLCLGGKETHGGTDGHVNQCNSIADVLRRGFKVNGGETSGPPASAYETVRLEFFANRFKEHQNSIKFAIARKERIQKAIMYLLAANSGLNEIDFAFLLDIASLVIAARRALSFTYPFRYDLKGENKQRYFDFVQQDLEQSLEKLNEKNEEDWTRHMDVDAVRKRPIMGTRFFKYKQDIITLQDAATRHLNALMADIEAGLPQVKAEQVTKTTDVKFASIVKQSNANWTCTICKENNRDFDATCRTCGSKRILPVDPMTIKNKPNDLINKKKPVAKKPAFGVGAAI